MPSKTGLRQDGKGQEQQTRTCLCSSPISDTDQCVSLGDSFCGTQLLICKILVGPQSLGSRLGDPVSSHGASLMAVSSGQESSIIWPKYWAWHIPLLPRKKSRESSEGPGSEAHEVLMKGFTFPKGFYRGLWVGARAGGSWRGEMISAVWSGGTCQGRYSPRPSPELENEQMEPETSTNAINLTLNVQRGRSLNPCNHKHHYYWFSAFKKKKGKFHIIFLCW